VVEQLSSNHEALSLIPSTPPPTNKSNFLDIKEFPSVMHHCYNVLFIFYKHDVEEEKQKVKNTKMEIMILLI
jgi:hypothetical protein